MIARALAWLAFAALAAFAAPVEALQVTPPGESAGIAVDDLPKEARGTLALIRKGGPFPYSRDGAVFGNREGLLPNRKRGYYREYTVKTPGERTRGARRIVAGGFEEFWYTENHYATFRRIRP